MFVVMPKITGISPQKSNPDKLNIFIDGSFCTGVRKRTFQAMNLKIGDEISCEQLKERENFFWKQAYQEVWKNEKVRIEKVAKLIESIDEKALVKIVGFGAASEVLIKDHPDEKGKPDIDVAHKLKPEITLLKIEVTGTERMRGADYWVRPDKIEYAENHPDEDVWIILHFSEPETIFICIQPIKGKKYERHKITIREAEEIFCIFKKGDAELKTLIEFSENLKTRLDEVSQTKQSY